MKIFQNILLSVGNKLVNLSYIITNPDYLKVRGINACPDIYKLLNKSWFPKDLITTVLDVGTNEGQFIRTIQVLLPEVMIYGFEANPKVFQGLTKESFNTSNVKISGIACGREKSVMLMNISKFSPSSSLLGISQAHVLEFPGTDIKETVDVQVERLDTIVKTFGDNTSEKYFLKIDVQGFEMEVLEGSTGILEETVLILCEANIAPLYSNQCNLESILMFMNKHKFDLIDVGEPFRSKIDQSILYIDLVFIKKS